MKSTLLPIREWQSCITDCGKHIVFIKIRHCKEGKRKASLFAFFLAFSPVLLYHINSYAFTTKEETHRYVTFCYYRTSLAES